MSKADLCWTRVQISAGGGHRDEKLRVKPKLTSVASGCQSADGRHVIKPPSTTGRPVTAPTYNLLSSPPHPAEPPPVTDPPESQTTNRAHRTTTNPSSSSSAAAGHVGGDGAELHGVLRRLGPRLRGHRAHPPPPRLRPRPQARLHLRPRLPLPDRRRLRLSPFPQGAGGGLATGALVPEERPRGRGLVQDQVRQGGRRRRALPAQGRPQGLRGLHKLCLLRPASRHAPGQVHLPPHRPQAWERGDEARGRGERDGICADLRGQGRRLDARRRRPLENVCGDLPAHPSHEKL